MKIVIVGPGAIGSLFAAHLARKNTDAEVMLFDKSPERADALRKSGISVEGVSGKWQIKTAVETDLRAFEGCELVMLCVKSYDTKPAIEKIKRAIPESAYVLTLQNGVGNIENISEAIGQERVIAGITNEGATLIEAGRVRHAGRGETVIGKSDGKIPVEMRRIRELFNASGLETRISRDIHGLIWSKLIINAGINALTGITRLANGKLLEFEGSRNILRDAVTEAVKVAKRKRIKLAYDDPLAKVESVCESTAANISSMLQDILRKKKTEVDYINGVIVRQAQSMGIPSPVNRMLLDLIKTIESSYEYMVA